MDELKQYLRTTADDPDSNLGMVRICERVLGYLSGYNDCQAGIRVRSMVSPGPPGPTAGKPEGQP